VGVRAVGRGIVEKRHHYTKLNIYPDIVQQVYT
jgi:hypothetical protein